MTIEKGQDWGQSGTAPSDVRVASSDPDVADRLDRVVTLSGGDLHRGLGEPRRVKPGDPCTMLPVDALRVDVTTVAGESVTFAAVAHVCVGRFGGRGGFEAVVNAGFVQGLNLTPRGHPGDGRLELISVSPEMTWRQRRMARRRARTGTHLPHPEIVVSQVETWTTERRDRRRLAVDGVEVAGWSTVSVRVMPGRVHVAV